MFELLPSSKTGIEFNNKVTENDSINPLDMEFLYNGGGVAVGDFNNDSLPDLYFTGSQVSNELYLNKGHFSFLNVTKTAGATGEGRWSNAASVVDINNDGWQDIYVCATIKRNPNERKNLLYINRGFQKDGIPRFTEMADAYHLADTGLSVQAAFFDYDNDGDLDVYIVTTKLAQRNSTRFDGKDIESDSPLSDRLYRNEGIPAGMDHPVFTNVSQEAGIHDRGYGLGIAVADLNNDGWKDIYVTNDFFGSDLLYINQRNGRFVDEAHICLKHASQSAMGNDIADINNDGLPEMIAVDMNPEDNYRKKKNMPGNNYNVYQRMMQVDDVLQYPRNTLQLNSGLIQADTSKPALPVFSDISFYAGVAETDWSWSPLFADFDNDGFKDLMVTNGYPRDVTDLDFAVYNSNFGNLTPKKDIIDQIPQIKISNYAYRNSGRLKFENVTETWGVKLPSFSNGAAYVDLDRDGDLDYVVNNINDEAFVYKSNASEITSNGYLNVSFVGDSLNKAGFGAVVEVFSKGTKQVIENYPYRGYLSTVQPIVHFGLGKANYIDSMIIKWPGNKKVQVFKRLAANTDLVAKITEATAYVALATPSKNPLFIPYKNPTLQFAHIERDNIDFDQQQLIPHKLSEYGPSLAAGDVDGNGLEDLFIGASSFHESYFFLAQPGGRYIQRMLPPIAGTNAPKPEVMGAILFDADGDGDLDLYTSSGSNELPPGNAYYRDRMFINDGKATFKYDSTAIPDNRISKSCAKAADFDNDGDLDLFVGGRLYPQQFPRPVSSMILRNDSKAGAVKFTDVTKTVAPGLLDFGLTCDVLWTDYDNDGWTDLITAGEWMPVNIFHNDHGKFKNVTASSGIGDLSGWWNSIAGGDFDNDGDIDFVVGNLGMNSFYRADSAHPAHIYAGDFNKNKTYIIVPSLYLPDANGNKQEFPAHTRNDVVNQLPALKKKFLTYKSFGVATIPDLFSEDDIKSAYKVTANYFKSAYFENAGNGRFICHELPAYAQFAPLNGMVVDDINDDGNLDLTVLANDYGTEVTNGRYDAMHGLVLLGDGKGKFDAPALEQTNFYVPGNAKALVKLKGVRNNYLLAASQNRDSLKVFELNRPGSTIIDLKPDDVSIQYHLANGKKRKEECYFGNSFLSQSSRFIIVGRSVQSIIVTNNKGQHRQHDFSSN